MLKNVQSLSLQQKLSPQLIQAQLLLAVPTMALEQKIKLEIEQNPLLEDVLETELDEVTDTEQEAAPDKKEETESSADYQSE